MLLDTSGLLCCLDSDEARHPIALQLYDSSGIRFTHNYIVAELVALAHARQLPRAESLAFAAEILRDPSIEIVWVDRQLHDEALVLLQSQLDKTYSHCDAVSFELMRQRGVTDALTTDGHFDQAGFRRLLPR